MKQHLVRSLAIVLVVAALVGCAGAKIVEETPMTEKLGQFKHAAIVASATDKKAESLVGDLETSMFKRLTKAKLFSNVTFGSTVDKNADLIIKADIYDSKLAEPGFKISFSGEPKVAVNIRYTMMSKKDNKVLGAFVAASDSNGQTSIGGISTNTDKGHALGKSNDQLVKYIKAHL